MNWSFLLVDCFWEFLNPKARTELFFIDSSRGSIQQIRKRSTSFVGSFLNQHLGKSRMPTYRLDLLPIGMDQWERIACNVYIYMHVYSNSKLESSEESKSKSVCVVLSRKPNNNKLESLNPLGVVNFLRSRDVMCSWRLLVQYKVF